MMLAEEILNGFYCFVVALDANGIGSGLVVIACFLAGGTGFQHEGA